MNVYYFGKHYTETPVAFNSDGSLTGITYSGLLFPHDGWALVTYEKISVEKHEELSEKHIQISDKIIYREYAVGSSYSSYCPNNIPAVPEAETNIMFAAGLILVALVCKFKRNRRA